MPGCDCPVMRRRSASLIPGKRACACSSTATAWVVAACMSSCAFRLFSSVYASTSLSSHICPCELLGVPGNTRRDGDDGGGPTALIASCPRWLPSPWRGDVCCLANPVWGGDGGGMSCTATLAAFPGGLRGPVAPRALPLRRGAAGSSTVAAVPIVGRTAAQCMEHYEALLDSAQAAQGGDAVAGAADARKAILIHNHILFFVSNFCTRVYMCLFFFFSSPAQKKSPVNTNRGSC